MRALAAAALTACLVAIAPAAASSTAYDFLPRAPITDLALSPSGDQLAVVMEVGSLKRIAVYDLAHPDADPLATEIPGLDPLWVAWANEDRLLVALAHWVFEVHGNSVVLPTARVVAMNADGSDQVVLFSDQQNVIRESFNLTQITDVLVDDPRHVLMPGVRRGDLDLWKVDVYTGEAERIATGSSTTYRWVTDINGAPAMRLDTNWRREITRVYTPEARSGANIRWRRVATVVERDRVEFHPLVYAPTPGVMYVAARPEGEDRAGIYRYDVADNRFLEKVASHPSVDVSGVLTDPRTGAYRGYFAVTDRLRYFWDDPDAQEHYDALDGYFGGGVNIRVIDSAYDGRTWLLHVTGPREPGAYYVYDRDDADAMEVNRVNRRFPRGDLCEVRPYTYRARDGMEIQAYLTQPAGLNLKPYRLVVLPHGGPEARDMVDYDQFAQFLATRGYLVFQPNFRGSAGYGKTFVEAGHKEWGGKMQDDITDGVRALFDEGLADPERTCIVGGSYGGYAALAGAAFTPDLYACVVSINGLSDLPKFLSEVRGDRDRRDDEYDYWKRVIGDPRADKAMLAARSPARFAANVTAPVLLIHGERDAIVPIEQSELMDKSLREAGKSVEFLRLKRAGHRDWDDTATLDAYERMQDFLAEHLPRD